MSLPVLHHERVTAPSPDPSDGSPDEPGRWLLVLHGIYGAGRNWGSVARRLVRERPDWGAVLVDLRQHGESMGFPGPHTLEAAADDLRALVRHESLTAPAVLGHSFGGKVAMRYAADPVGSLESLWVVDSTPDAGEPTGSAWRMLEVLRRHPGPFPSRGAGVEAVEAEGFPHPVARWMATNLERTDAGRYRWRLDVGDMESLLRDFFRSDTWDVVDSPPEGTTVHVVKARDSSILDEAACERIEAAGRGGEAVRLHRLEGGHWLNADNPGALVALLTREL